MEIDTKIELTISNIRFERTIAAGTDADAVIVIRNIVLVEGGRFAIFNVDPVEIVDEGIVDWDVFAELSESLVDDARIAEFTALLEEIQGETGQAKIRELLGNTPEVQPYREGRPGRMR